MAVHSDAVIWGYTAWYGTEWSEEMSNAGIQKIVPRTTSFQAFAGQVERYLKQPRQQPS